MSGRALIRGPRNNQRDAGDRVLPGDYVNLKTRDVMNVREMLVSKVIQFHVKFAR